MEEAEQAGALLPSEQQLLDELLEEDALCVLAAGLGWHKVAAALLRLHHAGGDAALQVAHGSSASTSTAAAAPPGPSGSGGVVIIIGAAPWQRQLLASELGRQAPTLPAPLDVSAEVPAADRVAHYAAGRACFVTSRILVVDLLSGRLPPRRVAGLLVLNAQRAADASGEAFAVRLYRQGNPRGWMRAFSDNAGALTAGFNKVCRGCDCVVGSED